MKILQLFAQDIKPNILIIQVDDMGYDDLAINGNIASKTPNLDDFAKESVRFDNFMVNSVSAPTRASLLTGRDFLRTGVTGVHAGKDFLSLEETTFADIFQSNGYATGMWGKWHSGKADGYWPWDRGFDEAYYAALYKYFPSYGYYNEYPKVTRHEGKWSPMVITDYTINFISRHKNEPFLAYASFLTCHSHWKTPEKYKQKYMAEGRSEKFAILLGMLEFMDNEVGRLLNHLADEGLDENTVVLFMSDNGPNRAKLLNAEEWRIRNNHQFVGAKANLYQNGIKSPLYVRWKGKYKTHDVKPLSTITDIFPTLLDIANIALPSNNKPIDGQSICPLLEGKNGWISKSAVFSQWFAIWEKNKLQPITDKDRATLTYDKQMFTLINDDYKLLQNAWRKPRAPEAIDGYVLIDLKKDPLEGTNVYNKYPEIATKMKQELSAWFDEIKKEEYAYSSPDFQIGWKNKSKSEILAFGLKKGIGVTNDNFWVTDIDSIGDQITYEIFVHKPGSYDIGMEVKDNQFKGVNIKIQCNNQTIFNELNGYATENIGQLKLSKGKHLFVIEVANTETPNLAFNGKINKFIFNRKQN